MGTKDTVLRGCEVICIGEQYADLICCPLSTVERLRCQQRRQYLAGQRELADWVDQHVLRRSVFIPVLEWRAKKKELGLGSIMRDR